MSLIIVACFVALGLAALGTSPTRDEMHARDAWVASHFARARPVGGDMRATQTPREGLLVLANHGPILRDGRPDGRRIKLAGQEFEHGLICHAPSKVVVCLPKPAMRLEATVGVDAHAGGGSVVFTVRAGAKELFRSDVLRGGEPGVAVVAELGGARQFTLLADDAGDGIACDHADWAAATVTFEDGSALRLSSLLDILPRSPERKAQSPPFAFTYGGVHSDALLPAWEYRMSSTGMSGARRRRTQTYREPGTGLELRCVSVTYSDYPVVEWTVYVRNSGLKDTPLIEGLQALDAILPAEGQSVLHRAIGSPCRADDYMPIADPLGVGEARRITASGGRPTNSDLCYFNLDAGDRGTIIALGWPGQWAATFDRDARSVRVVAGQEATRLVLHPGEEIRTPLVAMQFWHGGDWLRAQNVWRRWMIAHNLPRPNGRPIPTHYGGCWGNVMPRAEEEIAQIEGVARDGVRLDYWFIDAGWYPCRDSWTYTGTWEPDPVRFPKGLRQVGDVLARQGVGFIVWFEPERVTQGSWLAEHHPEWLLGGALLNLGEPAARSWVTDMLDAQMTQGRVGVLRTDFNMDPLPFWQANDADDRIGMTENRYVTGFLANWDELLKRRPGMWIDTCASGGRRNDLETLRRSVPLLRSDWAVIRFDREGAIGQQAQTWGISLWMPYHGTGCPTGDPYVMRSSYVPAFRMGWDATDPKRDPAVLRKAVAEFRRIAPYMLGDFHPLTPYSLAKDAWMAWQHDVPEKGEGAIQAFRREDCVAHTICLKLRGLDHRATYEVEDLDTGKTIHATGKELTDKGLKVTIPAKPGSAVFVYKRAP